ncbi:MAG TPA: HDIG domain-containing protein [Dehalococcoidia bacterium]|nr:HDIG domain-containing protein [Dehalococcoidia bacterium]
MQMLDRGKPRPISIWMAAAFGAALAALLLIALFPLFPSQFDVSVGDIASRTVRAPRSVSFESEYLTEQRRQEAAEAVQPVLVYEPDIRARQLEDYDGAIAQVSQIRGQTIDDQRKRDQLAGLQLSPRSIETALALSDERWDAVQAEGRRVLNEQLSVSLNEQSVQAARDGAAALVGPAFSADEALLAAELVRPRIVTTLIEDTDATEQAREAARAAVPAERVNVQDGDIILTADRRVDEVAIEKLRAVDLVSSRLEWANVLAAAIVSVAAAAALAAYLFVLQPKGISSERHLIALAVVCALPVLVAKFYLAATMPDDQGMYLPYILPVAAAPVLVASLLETDVAVVMAALIGLLAGFVSIFLPDVSLVTSISVIDTFRLVAVYGLAPLAGVFAVHRADRLGRYLTAGIGIGVVAFLMLFATWLVDNDRGASDVAWMALASALNGLGAGVLAAGAFVTIGVLFGVTTRVQLMELSQLNAPLLRRLQDEAPGTFHHSIIVGNLAERAADLIGADPLLTRVGCYYHDIGKVLQPGMYIENQLGGETPHEEMSPEESAATIKQHVLGGLELARRERLPARVQQFIPEHHGTRLVAYFYRKAAERDPDVDADAFTYPGPKPQSRETAIVMLADSTEAYIRSSPDRSPEHIDQMVDEVIAERLAEGQLDESDLTLKDLRIIADSFKATMRAVYHPRVQYPQPTPMEARRRLRLPPVRMPAPQRPAPVRRRPRKYER